MQNVGQAILVHQGKFEKGQLKIKVSIKAGPYIDITDLNIRLKNL